MNKSANEILGNVNYPAISYGGYRDVSRDIQPTIEEIKEDMIILNSLGYRLIRMYDVHYQHTENTLKAIREIKDNNNDFEMYMMMGAWIDCKDAWTDNPDHQNEDEEKNKIEILEAVRLANKYEDIVKIIAVGNESMVHWATSYHVLPGVILKWTKYLNNLKDSNRLSKDVLITSSDNFASWGGGDKAYHNDDLIDLINEVDFISMHTYPFHDTFYNNVFWNIKELNEQYSIEEISKILINNSVEYAINQYESVKNFLKINGIEKQIHIGETGWASVSTDNYGDAGTKAADEYKQALYFKKINRFCNDEGITCFYFSAFNEPWKDFKNEYGSENHFGIFTSDGKAKYVIWDKVDYLNSLGLKRGNKPIIKTFDGEYDQLKDTIKKPDYR